MRRAQFLFRPLSAPKPFKRHRHPPITALHTPACFLKPLPQPLPLRMIMAIPHIVHIDPDKRLPPVHTPLDLGAQAIFAQEIDHIRHCPISGHFRQAQQDQTHNTAASASRTSAGSRPQRDSDRRGWGQCRSRCSRPRDYARARLDCGPCSTSAPPPLLHHTTYIAASLVTLVAGPAAAIAASRSSRRCIRSRATSSCRMLCIAA